MPDVRLTRYQVMEPLGRGSQGHTYRGIDRANGAEVAIKIISLRHLDDWKAFDLFERECKVLARLSHPGVPRYIDHYASEETGDFFLVMGLAAGRSLRARQREGERFDAERLRELLAQALDILAYLHDQVPPVIHRDIKPSNFVLSDDGKLTLVDFGGVRLALREGGGSTLIGTFGFMAPEQLHGEASPATDIYALGATLVCLASGSDPEELPRKGLRIDLEQIMARHPLRPLLEEMLEPDPDQRLESASQVRARLAELGQAGSSKKKRSRSPSKTATGASQGSGFSGAGKRDQALVVIPEQVQALAQTRSAVGRVFIWLFASLASGTLTLVEAVFLPLILRVAFAWQRSDEARAELRRDHAQNLEAVRSSRRTLRWLTDATNPVDRD